MLHFVIRVASPLSFVDIPRKRPRGISKLARSASTSCPPMQTVPYGFHFPATAFATPVPDESLLFSERPGLVLDSQHSLAVRLLLARRLAHLPSVPADRDWICAALRDVGSAWAGMVELVTSCRNRIQTSVDVVVGVAMQVEEACFGASELNVAKLEACRACLRQTVSLIELRRVHLVHGSLAVRMKVPCGPG